MVFIFPNPPCTTIFFKPHSLNTVHITHLKMCIITSWWVSLSSSKKFCKIAAVLSVVLVAVLSAAYLKPVGPMQTKRFGFIYKNGRDDL